MTQINPLDYHPPDIERTRDRRGFLRPFSWGFFAFVLALSLYTTWQARLPTMGWLALPLGFCWVVTGVVLCVRLVGRVVALSLLDSIERSEECFEPRNWLVFLLAGLTLVGWLSGATQRAAFQLSLPALNRFATGVAALPAGAKIPNQWVGVYNAKQIIQFPVGCRFTTGPADFIDTSGLAYTRGPALPSIKGRYIPLGGGWSFFIQRF